MRRLRLWLVVTALCAAGVQAESRITVLPPASDARTSASARLRFEVVVPRTLMLEAGGGAAQAWGNHGTLAAQCASPGTPACRDRVFGSAGVNQWSLPAGPPSVAQP